MSCVPASRNQLEEGVSEALSEAAGVADAVAEDVLDDVSVAALRCDLGQLEPRAERGRSARAERASEATIISL